jgi:hypothetical protein
MAIKGNTTSSLGDTFLIIPTKPLGMVKTIDGVDWVVSGETANWFYKKEYRIQINGGVWSFWDAINNLISYPIDETVSYQVQFRFTHSKSRTATGVSPILGFTSVTIEGDNVKIDCGVVYNESIFGQWFDCDVNLEWCLNVAHKMYEPGIVPAYILRGVEVEDEDYLAFWKSIACFFAIIVEFGRRISKFDEDLIMLKEFLKNRTMFFCDAETDLAKLHDLAEQYLNEIQQRGSWGVIDEIQRYICYDAGDTTTHPPTLPFDEFIFNLRPNKYVGWNVGNSSPTYKSIHFQHTLNKNYQPDGKFKDLSKYPLIGAPTASGADEEELVCAAGTGIGDGFEKLIPISPFLNYAISFDVKMVRAGTFTFGVKTLDKDENVIKTHNIEDDSVDVTFVDGISLNQADIWYNIIGILYNEDQITNPNNVKPNIGFGNHLKMQHDSFVKVARMMPVIKCDSGTIVIRNLQIKPASLPYSTGFIQTANWIDFIFKNNNGRLLWDDKQNDYPELYRDVKKFLIPYNCILEDVALRKDLYKY